MSDKDLPVKCKVHGTTYIEYRQNAPSHFYDFNVVCSACNGGRICTRSLEQVEALVAIWSGQGIEFKIVPQPTDTFNDLFSTDE